MDNKFLQRLKGEKTPKAVVEIQDPTLRQGMPDVPGTTPMVESVHNEMSNTLVVAKGAKCFGVNGGDLTPTTTDEYAGMRQVAGEGAWINASYTFPPSQTRNPVVQIINPNSKWILRLMGDNLLSDNEVINFTLLVRAGATTVATKDIAVRRQANQFCKTLEIDFAESVADVVKINGGDTLTVQLLCNDGTARANIYGGKTVLTLLDRALDGVDIQATTMTFEEAAQKIDALERDKADKTYVDATFETKADAEADYKDLDGKITALQKLTTENFEYLDANKADKDDDFETPITPSNKGVTMTEVNNINQHISALEGVGGLLSPYNFGKTFENPITAAVDIQTILAYFIGQIWEGATDIVFNTMDYALTSFKDAVGAEHTAAEIFNATAVTNSFDNTRIQLNNTQNTDPKVFEFTNQGILLVGIANQTTAGIVRAGPKGHIVVNSETGDVILNNSNAPDIRTTINSLDRRLAELVSDLTPEEQGIVRDKLGIVTSSSGINPGNMFFSTRLDNELFGAVETNGVRYSLSAVGAIGKGSLQALLQESKLPFISLDAHAAKIAQYGFCYEWGWDGGDIVAVPYLTAYLVQKHNIPVIGNGNGLGVLTNDPETTFSVGVSAQANVNRINYNATLGAAGTANGTGQVHSVLGVTTDAEKSGLIADLTNTAGQPRVMVQLFNATTDEALATVTGVLADVAELKNMMGLVSGRFLVRRKEPTADDPSWFNLFSDGYCEQGSDIGAGNDIQVPLLISMKDAQYYVDVTWKGGKNSNFYANDAKIYNRTTTNFTTTLTSNSTNVQGLCWVVSGYADPSEYAADKWNVRPAANGLLWLPVAPQTDGTYSLGLTMKGGTPTPYWGQSFVRPPSAPERYLVRLKRPTADDPYFYNIYSDGYCEQGGGLNNSTSVTFAVQMASAQYVVVTGQRSSDEGAVYNVQFYNQTVKGFSCRQVGSNAGWTGSGSANGWWMASGYADPSEYTNDKWGDDTPSEAWSAYLTGDPSPFKFKAWTNAGGETVYTLLAVPTGRGDDMYTEDQLGVYNEWDANQSTAPLPKVADKCGAIGTVGMSRGINGGGVEMGDIGTFESGTAYMRNQALDTNG